ncbi:MAG: aminoacyl-tRNA hydrolase [Lachnospiraceae bacterium]|nr:aminoacyl-tRNA hydrolase [Lachnospiraceae bacterium]
MYVIVGLGNPGKKYENTRHNVGFAVIDKLAKDCDIKVNKSKHSAKIGEGVIEGEKVVLAKPQTYMNLSGMSVRSLMDFYKIDPESELIIISDDIDLPTGNLRIRKSGSAGGHNGLKSIIANVGTQGFTRIRVGVGAKIEGEDLADHVLGHFNKDDAKIIEIAAETAAEAIKTMLTDGVDKAMNKFNTKKRKDDASTTDPA